MGFKNSEDFTVTVAAGQFENFDYSGRFVKCLASTGIGRVSIDHSGKSTFRAGLGKRIEQSEQPFESFQVYNDTAEDIEFTIAYGFGDISDTSLSLTGELNLANDAANPLFCVAQDANGNAIEVISGSTNQLRTYDANVKDVEALLKGDVDGMVLGKLKLAFKSGFNESTLNATPTEIISPSANTNGAILELATMQAGNSFAMIGMKQTPPTSYYDPDIKPILFAYSGNAHLPYRVMIPAGYGLYGVASSSNSGNRAGGLFEIL